MANKKFEGIYAVLVTPFKDDESIDVEILTRRIGEIEQM